MKKLILILVIFSLIVVAFISNSFAVIFAADAIYLFEDGKRVKDNSIICKPANEKSKRFKVCEDGFYYLRQKVESNEIIFFKTDDPDILTQAEWWDIKHDDRPAETYAKYLEQKAEAAIYSKQIVIPDATDRGTYNSPPDGMTGGTIGSGRDFLVDIVAGKIIQPEKNE